MRIGILDAVRVAMPRFSVEDIYRRLQGTDAAASVGSTYRVIADLTSAGIVKREWISSCGGPKAVFTLTGRQAETGDVGNQQRCRRCGHSVAITDATILELWQLLAGAEQLRGYQPQLTIETQGCSHCC